MFGDPIFGSFSDARDGNTYQTVTIGDQIWMAENLKYFVEGSKVYDDDPLNEAIYGRLYNWEQIMNGEETSNENPSGVQGISPVSWHIPSQTEWDELIHFLGGHFDSYAYFSDAGKRLKEAGTEHWDTGNTGDNESGFSAIPGGIYNTNYGIGYIGIGNVATFISCSWSVDYSVSVDDDYVFKYNHSFYSSLRCIKN